MILRPVLLHRRGRKNPGRRRQVSPGARQRPQPQPPSPGCRPGTHGGGRAARMAPCTSLSPAVCGAALRLRRWPACTVQHVPRRRLTAPGPTARAAARCPGGCACRPSLGPGPWCCIRMAWVATGKALPCGARPGPMPVWPCCTCSTRAATPRRCAAAWPHCARQRRPHSCWPVCATCGMRSTKSAGLRRNHPALFGASKTRCRCG